MIFWISGNSGAGKTRLAWEIHSNIKNSIVLDGDELRQVWPGLTFSREDRYEQGFRIARLAKVIETQSYIPIVACIAPYKDLRTELAKQYGIVFIYLSGGKPSSQEYPYEP